jgi:hypothetical protein
VVEVSRRLLGRGLPEALFNQLLITPPDEMFYVETTGEAVAYEISIESDVVYDGSVEEIVNNICDAAEDGVRARSSPWTHGTGAGYQRPVRRVAANEFEIDGFLNEASYTCSVRFGASPYRSSQNVVGLAVFGIRDGATFSAAAQFGDGVEVTNLMTFPFDHRLMDLERQTGPDVDEFLRSFLAPEQAASSRPSCAVGASNVRVVNVNEFVNVRQDPSLRAQIVARARLGERLRVIEPDQWWYLEDPEGQQCARFCDMLSRVPDAPSVQRVTRQCIEQAQIWQRVQNSRGQIGFVSVNFLEALE